MEPRIGPITSYERGACTGATSTTVRVAGLRAVCCLIIGTVLAGCAGRSQTTASTQRSTAVGSAVASVVPVGTASASPARTVYPSALPPPSFSRPPGLPRGCLTVDARIDVVAGQPPESVCLHVGTQLTVLLAASALGPWMAPTNSAPGVVAINSRHTNQGRTVLVRAVTAGHATLSSQTVPADPHGPPSAVWTLTLTVV